MKDHLGRSMVARLAWAMALAAGGGIVAIGDAARAQVLYEDVRIQGRELHAFRDDSQDVLVALGDFRLDAGAVRLSGRDAVVWVAPKSGGRQTRQEITVYVEGDARRMQDGKVVRRGQSLLSSLEVEGRVIAEGTLSRQSLADFPLYQRAAQARATGATAPRPVAQTAPAAPQAAPSPAAPPGAPQEQAVGQTQPASAAAEQESRPAPPPPPPGPQALKPVNYFADQASSVELGAGEDWRRAVVLRGGVYVSQGDPDSDLFLELRSQSAVIFFRKAPPQPTEKPPSPLRLRLEAAPGQEIPDGVYLEGDVAISRGERALRGPVAYYDFVAEQAVMLDPVFRTIQEQRNIPVYIRANEARMLSASELLFRDAQVTSSDFETPSYAIAAKTAYLKDTAVYDDTGQRLSPPSWEGRLKHARWNIYDVPVFYWPYTHADFEQGHTALRKVGIGYDRDLGYGVESQWQLFRLLGLVRPQGFRGVLDLDYFERGLMGGPSVQYARRDYSGYSQAYGVFDQGDDDFGDRRSDIRAPDQRGRVLMRHKQYLPNQWLLQAELGYVSDRNFMEAYFPAEHFAGKEQETLLYARKQQDNWALTALLQQRLNRFDTQTEAAPDLGFALAGQPLLEDALTFHDESHAGLLRWRVDQDPRRRGAVSDSDFMERLDTRNEIDAPLHAGPVNVMPYAAGRLSHWGDAPPGGEHNRAYGQVGVRANTHLWRVYNSASSRLLDIHRLRHIITPEATAFASDNGGQGPDKLFPMDPSIEQHLIRLGGAAVGIYQRLQTKRGPAADQRNVDWMRLDLVAMFYDTNQGDGRPSNGDFFWYRPEYSLPRNSLNGHYSWQVSDSTAFLSNLNYDLNRGIIGQADAGVALSRDPRARYYAGWRWLRDLDSELGTFGLNYQLTRKYSFSAFEQYDFDFDGGRNTATNVSLIRKFERWYAGVTVTFIQRRAQDDEVAVMLTLWPEGVPELRLGSRQLDVFGSSQEN